MKQFVTRAFELDIGHRVMDEHEKCFSIHGHRIKIELTLLCTTQQDIGFLIDFKEIKRIAGSWLEERLDHGFIANPCDEAMIAANSAVSGKLYLMSLNGEGKYCNPTAENISRELFITMELLFQNHAGITVQHIRLYETPNCWVDTTSESISATERSHFYDYQGAAIKSYADKFM